MSNPFLKKNPFMSMFLSGANRMAATMRGQATAQARRQIKAAVNKATNDSLKTLLDAPAPTAPKTKRKRHR